jgi:hypothetical protein
MEAGLGLITKQPIIIRGPFLLAIDLTIERLIALVNLFSDSFPM